MKAERAAMLAGAMVQSLGHWADELRSIRAVPGPEGEDRKRHLVCALDQARQSLSQLVARSGKVD